MALLLAMYQKMRLIREKNQVTLDLTKYSSKLDRVTKNIERVQKRYTSLFAQLESQAKMMQSNATMMFQQMAGLGMNSVNLNNYTGMNVFVCNAMAGMLSKGIKFAQDADPHTMNEATYNALMNHYMSNGGQFVPQKDEDGNPLKVDGVLQYNDFTADDVKAFTMAQRQAQAAQQQAQMWVQNANQQYGNNVSIWLEAAKAQLEAEQDAALEPLSYQETMWELEKTQADNKLKRINAQLESYDQLVSSESEKTAPTFGLR